MIIKFTLICFGFCLLSVTGVKADEYRPAYLEFKQINQDSFAMLWKVPALGSGARLKLSVVLPPDMQVMQSTPGSLVGNAYIKTSRVRRPGGLAGAEIVIEGLSAVSTEALVRIERLDNTTEVARLTPSSPSFTVSAAPSFGEVVRTYLVFGVEHILRGLDHLLFVACLILIAGSWRRILITITGFTVAHSLTLSLAALGVVRLPVPPIEATIALSIVFLAREIAVARRDTLVWRYPIAVSSIFGLLHGFGFASALQEIGLPQTEIPAALLSFNVGVEIGQIMFVGAFMACLWAAQAGLRQYAVGSGQRFNAVESLHHIDQPLAYTVGVVAMTWTLQRVSAFWLY